jgi:hypothetical protein
MVIAAAAASPAVMLWPRRERPVGVEIAPETSCYARWPNVSSGALPPNQFPILDMTLGAAGGAK